MRMTPWFRGFKGSIELKDDKSSYIVKGKFERRREELIITELPIQVWSRNYKNFLEELAQKDIITDIREFHKDNSIRFELTVPDLQKKNDEEIEKEFKLTANLSCTNFVLFDKDYKIRRYTNEKEIMNEFFEYRFSMYEKRKQDMLKRLN